jgi:hypothetical protein
MKIVVQHCGSGMSLQHICSIINDQNLSDFLVTIIPEGSNLTIIFKIPDELYAVMQMKNRWATPEEVAKAPEIISVDK